MTAKDSGPISLFIPGLEGGGAQRVFVNLANSLVKTTDYPVHLVVVRADGVFETELHPSVKKVDLRTGRMSRSIPALVRYLRSVNPSVMMATMNYCNIIAIVAWRMAGRPCRLVVREANVVQAGNRLIKALMRLTYPQADSVIALSPEIKESILLAGIPVADRIVVIGNPSVMPSLSCSGPELAFLPNPRPRFICAAGNLSRQKGFDILLSSFALLADRDVHLVILGEGSLRRELEAQCHALGVNKRVHMPGFVTNPWDVIRFAEVFVLSSRWEGFPNVLLEALSTGVPIVAADCPGAPRSILEDGRHGHLVTPEDPKALSEALDAALKAPIGTAESRRGRAAEFSVEVITKRYLCDAFGMPL